MPKFLEQKLKAEYPNNPRAVYGTLNNIGAMHGNKETAKGKRMEAQHDADMKAPRSTQYGRHPGTISHQETSTMRHVGGSSRENKGGY